MQKTLYKKPNTKVHVPRLELLQIPLVDTSKPEAPIESKGNNAFEEDEQTHMWGRVWGRVDD